MTHDRLSRAREAESLVAKRLASEGFEIIGRNVRVGRLELDILGRRRDLLVVCEVRSRASRSPVHPAETIDRRKIERIRRATAQWLAQNRPAPRQLRFDAAAVLFDESGAVARIDYYEDAF